MTMQTLVKSFSTISADGVFLVGGRYTDTYTNPWKAAAQELTYKEVLKT